MKQSDAYLPHSPRPRPHVTLLRQPRSAAVLALLVGLATPVAGLADTRTGSMSFQLLSQPFGGAVIDLSALPDLAKLQLSRVRATFTADVLGDMHQSGVLQPDYSLRYKELNIYTAPHCYNLPLAWCGVERSYYTRDVVTTLSQSDYAQMRVQIGGAAGVDQVKGSLTESSLQFQGSTNEERRSSFIDGSNPDSIGLMEVFKYYETNNYLRMVWSSKTQLSVTLDLDAATMAEISSTGRLRYEGFAELISNPALRLDYVGVSAVPEAGSASLALAGLALLAGAGARRKRNC